MDVGRAWMVLVVAGLFEVGWSVGLKYTAGFTRLVPSVLTAAAIVASMWLLAHAAKTLPIGTAYAVWVGIGTVGATVLGAWLFGEAMPPARVVCLVLLVGGIVGLKLTARPSAPPSDSSDPSGGGVTTDTPE